MQKAHKSKLFVASSIEARPVANQIKEILERSKYQVQLWTEDFFQPGTSTYSSVATHIRDFDGGIFVLSPDDGYLSRNGPGWTPRPNVLFELGMFSGVLGMGNCLQIRLKVKGTLPHLGREITFPRAMIEEVSDLCGITWIEAEAQGTTSGGRTEFRLEEKGIWKIERAIQTRAERDARALHQLQEAPQLMALWKEGREWQPCPAELLVFGDRVRVRLRWTSARREYDVSLKFEGEDRLTGPWWDSSDRGYAGQASFQVRSRPSYLLGHWIGWSGNGGVKSGAFIMVDKESEEEAKQDYKKVRRAHKVR